MPEISRFYGLSIRMYVERGERHHLPHFHAIYQGKAAAFRIDTGELVGGYLPLRQRRLVEACRASSRRVAGELAAFAE